MKKSSLAHGASIIAGILGTVALISAWIAGDSGVFLGFSQSHLYNDAIVLTLLSIASAVCSLIYLKRNQ